MYYRATECNATVRLAILCMVITYFSTSMLRLLLPLSPTVFNLNPPLRNPSYRPESVKFGHIQNVDEYSRASIGESES